MRIGIDFDNTIINYDSVFVQAAKRRGLILGDFAGSTKQAVRDAIRLLPDGEIAWQKLQGFVYAHAIADGAMLEGLEQFMRRCRQEGYKVLIVSHKTKFGHFDPARKNLRTAALDWMRAHGFFQDDGFGVAAENVFFEDTRGEKIRRIASLACSHFIDDLPEVLSDPDFPPSVERILLSVDGTELTNVPFAVYRSWREIAEHIFR
jgi:phosphoserine phosphatase